MMKGYTVVDNSAFRKTKHWFDSICTLQHLLEFGIRCALCVDETQT